MPKPKDLQKGQPYIINIESKSNDIQKDVEIFGSYQYVNECNKKGNLENKFIKIDSGIAGITYEEMLYCFINNPFTTNSTNVISKNENQVVKTICLRSKDARGNVAQRTISPIKDNSIKTISSSNLAYRIDGFTKLIISEILPKASVKLVLYPYQEIEELKLSSFEKFINWLNKR
jgi:hypothetical protein